ncbi:MAG: rhodanese-like domain-containing protein [gamma proteobacterium symbiont of Bathyaustriella thionipta]|nr:rhodanese-like domain-containing protein [gamma proteobacterium symbiont of Bathyaustriella thionipta]MCU7948823.1 rhodanese-like domain-containing protein [gamma proteobacterium symbiont of Bathyaustriella thionipta]MCU7954366.1 rhodanese-like domain-containing protein [gamma proteobacterium symbiont of Bathyaustriella thionipta]MCU7955281.1 rhodanese-like domain-containing protein [gamma proteobacterium symbiont of Bathyaustriella thionipta]MCU7967456.1 rhodanese-like domain-containing pro
MEHLNEFVTTNWVMILLWFFLLGMIINSFLKSSYDISPQQAVQLMSHENGSLVLDVREDSEYQAGHIKDSVHIPMGSLASRVSELDKYKNKNVILGCRSGSRSGRACSILKKNGFEKVHNLRGGVLAWEKDNLPMKKG